VTERPTLSAPVTIAEWWKNRRGESIRVTLSTYQGCNICDVRTYCSTEGRLKPTTKGFCADVGHLPRLVSALSKACSQARELGLIASDDQGSAE